MKSIMILAGGVLTGTFLLMLVYCLPLSTESSNVKFSMQILEEEGWYPTLPWVTSFEGHTTHLNEGGVLDNYTDSIMIATAGADTNGRPWYQAMKAENSVMGAGYSYYWHGYVILLRPLLILLDYAEIRVLNEMAQFLLVLALFCLVKRRKGMAWAMVSLSVYGLLFPMALAYSLQYSWVFYISVIGSVLLFLFEDFWRKNQNIYWFFLVIGMVTSYLDLLTYPLITWGIPMIWWMVLDPDENTELCRIRTIVISGLFWILGYGGMWAGKWLIGELIIEEPIIRNAIDEVLLRSGVKEGVDGKSVSRLETLWRNLGRCNSIQYVIILGSWFVWLGYHFVKNRGVYKPHKTFAYSLIAVSVFVWYAVLHNHTHIHCNFTYRIFTIFFVAVLAGFLTVIEKNSCMEAKSPWIVKWAPVLAIGLCSVVAAFSERQEVWIHNGESEYISVQLEEGQCVEQPFVPLESYVSDIQAGIRAEGDLKGVFVIEILKEDTVIVTRNIAAEEVANRGFYFVPLDMRLEKGSPYILRISMEENEGTTGWISVTKEGNYVLKEFDSVSVNDTYWASQMIGGITYRTLPGKWKIALNFLASVWFLGMICSCGYFAWETLRKRAEKCKRVASDNSCKK